MAGKLQSPRGFHDLTGSDLRRFRRVSSVCRELFTRYGFEEIILPVVEYAELFERSIGEATDIVQKEMFVFTDRKGRRLALRPEGTAGAVRAFIQNNLYALRPYHKLFYEGPMFRYERPQAGRYRQFHQAGVEIFGVADPLADAELLKLVSDILETLGIPAVMELNSLGCRNCRGGYRDALLSYLEGVADHLCEVCFDRKNRNPLRVLDCKVESCRRAVASAPKMIDFLCEECREHYRRVKEYLKELGVGFRENLNLVRGLDYYTRTVFEAVSDELGTALIAGGRYDYLVEEFGGPPTPALGFAVGIERLMLLVEDPGREEELYLLIPFGDVWSYALKVASLLRYRGKKVEVSYRRGGLRKQLEFANRIKADFAVIVGEEEVKEGVVTLKDLRSGEQRRLRPEEIP
ncbi:MAG TPA: histidine--tRNA ligase [Aquifex aeolicus]|uniref:Histidine--tRNA ligase n=1 Tax=Aquifex aeolicus TaxID=63363 RepID=A0A7C5L6Q8_AQUAO|nr:histidine--tRNA ligase [Aquifex aeolicus]